MIAALFISLFLQNPIVSSDCGGQGRDCAPTEYSSSMGVTEVKCAPGCDPKVVVTTTMITTRGKSQGRECDCSIQ